MTKRLLVLGTAVMTTLLELLVLWQFRVVVIYVLISLALAATVRLVVRSESRSSFATRLLRILLYVVSIVIFGLLIFLVGRLLVNDLQQLAQTVSVQSSWMLPAGLEGGLQVGIGVAALAIAPVKPVPPSPGADAQPADLQSSFAQRHLVGGGEFPRPRARRFAAAGGPRGRDTGGAGQVGGP